LSCRWRPIKSRSRREREAANMVALGAFLGASGLVSPDLVRDVLAETFSGRQKIVQLNRCACRRATRSGKLTRRRWPGADGGDRVMAKKLMKGCEAIGEAAIQSGCGCSSVSHHPQNEIPEYMSGRLRRSGRVRPGRERGRRVQHALRRGRGRVPVLHLVVEPGHLADAGRHFVPRRRRGARRDCQHHAGRPGLGGILPSQSDYLQATKAAATATTASWCWRLRRSKRPPISRWRRSTSPTSTAIR